MAKKRGRPKGAGNFKHRHSNEQLGIAMAVLLIQNPSWTIWQAARKVAPDAPDYDGDHTHQGKVVRRLHGFYKDNSLRLKQAARRRLNPPRPITPFEVLVQQQRQIEALHRSMKPALDEARRLADLETLLRRFKGG